MSTDVTARQLDREKSQPTHMRAIARVGGLSYLAMFALAIVANFLVLEQMVVEGDAVATTQRIADSPGVFLTGVVLFGVIAILDVILAWVLYMVFRSVNEPMARVMGYARAVYGGFLAVGVFFLARALSSAVSGPVSEVSAQAVARDIDTFNTLWLVGLAVFGVHLVLLGWLVFRATFAPNILGIIVMVAGEAYVVDTIAQLSMGNYASVAPIMLALVALPSMIAEGWMGGWLLFSRGIPSAVAGSTSV